MKFRLKVINIGNGLSINLKLQSVESGKLRKALGGSAN